MPSPPPGAGEARPAVRQGAEGVDTRRVNTWSPPPAGAFLLCTLSALRLRRSAPLPPAGEAKTRSPPRVAFIRTANPLWACTPWVHTERIEVLSRATADPGSGGETPCYPSSSWGYWPGS